jgi:hypothetical protein
MANNTNPLAGHFRSPKIYTQLPSKGKFYSSEVIDMPETGELPVYPMTAKDELMLKNPDALLNGEAISTVIGSCIPKIKQPRMLLSNDIDALLIAIQGATFGDDMDVSSACDKCEETITEKISVEGALSTMSTLDEAYQFNTDTGLLIDVRPFSYETSVKAGVANFRSERSLQSIANIDDEIERISAFNSNFIELSQLNFDIMVDSVASITIPAEDKDSEDIIVSDSKNIRDFLENCESAVGKQIEEFISEIANIGVNKEVLMRCEKCGTEEEPYEFQALVNFNPVNFFTAS